MAKKFTLFCSRYKTRLPSFCMFQVEPTPPPQQATLAHKLVALFIMISTTTTLKLPDLFLRLVVCVKPLRTLDSFFFPNSCSVTTFLVASR